jgi:hypothetical protein
MRLSKNLIESFTSAAALATAKKRMAAWAATMYLRITGNIAPSIWKKSFVSAYTGRRPGHFIVGMLR